jgi:hypothetical protein
MECPRCGKMNEPSAKFCSRCGIEMATVKRPAEVTEADAVLCYRHKRELTRLSCGKCGRPVCHRCAINGPAGIRCGDCGKMDIPFNPRGAWFGFQRSISGMFGRSPYMIYMVIFLLMSVFGVIRGCATQPTRNQPPYTESRDELSAPP